MIAARRVIEIVDRLERERVESWLDGGWGVEALLGGEHRLHADVDVVLRLDEVDRVLGALAALGYRPHLDLRPTRVVLRDAADRSIDLHPMTFAEDGTGWQAGAGPGGGAARYPADGFRHGTVGGRPVGCLSAELQLAHHRGYSPGAVDVSDMARLCTRFALPWPPEYPPLYATDGEDDGERLAGGNVTPIVRVGRTVRRSVGPWTPAVHALLAHLAGRGFTPAPRVLGIDEQGREVLTYFDGDVGWPAPAGEQASEGAVLAIGRVVRSYHDAVSDFSPPPDARWQRLLGTPGSGELVCHNDVAPWNVVYRRTEPIGLLDWDLAAPATPLWDLAYAAWRFVPLYADADLAAMGWRHPLDRGRRLQLLCDAYGLARAHRVELLEVVRLRQMSAYESMRAWAEEGTPAWREMWETGHGEGVLRDLSFLDRHFEQWQRDLVRRAGE